MSDSRLSSRLLVLLGVASFLAALVYFAQLSSSDSYPRYSSLRSDQTGSKLLFEALRSTGKVDVARSYVPLRLLRVKNAVVMLIGVSPIAVLSWDNAYLTNLERLAKAGNRLVIGVTDEESSRQFHDESHSAVETRWKLRVTDSGQLTSQPGNNWQTLLGTSSSDLISKPFGTGRVTFLFHAGKLNDENLAVKPDAATLISAAIGSQHRVVFDESHLGLEETGSIAALGRRYRLGGLFAGLLLFALLFLWSQARCFPPQRSEPKTQKVVIGGDERAMLASLLGRHLSRPDMIALCISEWNRLRPKNRITDFPGPQSDPVAAYRQIQEELEGSKRIRV